MEKKYINELEQEFNYWGNGKGQEFATADSLEYLRRKLNEVIRALNDL